MNENMREYTVGHSGFYGSEGDKFVKIPEGAIVVGPHTKIGKTFQVGTWLGIIPKMAQYNTPGIRYLVPRNRKEE